MIEKIGILGGGGQANETASYAGIENVSFRAVDSKYLNETTQDCIDILNPAEFQRTMPVIAAVGAPAVRRAMVEKWPGERYGIVAAEESYIDSTAKIGDGSVIAPRAVITTDVEIGRHAIVNVAATISHNCKIGDYVTISPGAHIAGNVHIGDGVFVGIGAIISNGVSIAPGSVIGAGAVVIRNIDEENSVMVGAPAKLIRHNEGWLEHV